MKQVYLVLLLLLVNESVAALDIEKAYRLIPHQRTVFQINQSTLPASDAHSVAELLNLAELAMVERVDAMIKGPRQSRYLDDIELILKQMNQLQLPSEVRTARTHILVAIQQQRAFFQLYDAGDAQAKTTRQQLVQSSHRHLISAYQVLMKSYPDETQHNKQAFFDYLCALDFI